MRKHLVDITLEPSGWYFQPSAPYRLGCLLITLLPPLLLEP